MNEASHQRPDDSHESGHAGLQFQPAFPVSRGRLAIWLFLSTEAMFFSALIGAYLVLRLGAGAGQWPTREAMHMVVWIGLVNTLILTASSVTMWLAVRCCKSSQPGRAKGWLGATLILGTVFLGIKGYEYQEKFKRGIHPRQPQSLIYSRADVHYLAAMRQHIGQEIAALELQADGPGLSAKERLQLERYYGLLKNMVGWTNYQIGVEPDATASSRLIEQVASAVYPQGDHSLAGPQFEEQQAPLWTALEKDKSTRATLVRRIEQFETELNEIQRQLEEQSSEPPMRLTGPAFHRQDQDSRQDETLQQQQRQLQQDHQQALQSLGDLNQQIERGEGRLAFLIELETAHEGINHHFDMTLPMVIPGGRLWVNTYFLLTGFHAIHLAAGLVLLLCLVPLRAGIARLGVLENVSCYWHFVDMVWLVLFPILYLL